MKKFKKIIALLWAIRPGGDIHQRSIYLISKLGLNVDVKGTIPKQQCILVSNHVGYLDPVIIASKVKCLPIAKKELSTWPIFGYCLKKFGLIFYERQNVLSGVKTIYQSFKALKKGSNMLVFPEGTTTRGDTVLPFKRGMFGVSKITGIPVVPVRIKFDNPNCSWAEQDSRSLAQHYWWLTSLKAINVTIEFFDPIFPNPLESPGDMACKVCDIICCTNVTSSDAFK